MLTKKLLALDGILAGGRDDVRVKGFVTLQSNSRDKAFNRNKPFTCNSRDKAFNRNEPFNCYTCKKGL